MSKQSEPTAFARTQSVALDSLHPDVAPAGPLAIRSPDAAPPTRVGEADETSPTPYIDANGYDPADYRWVAVRRRPRKDGWSEARQRRFIEVLADTGEAETAARTIGMSVQSAYALRRAPGGEAFAAAWDAARANAANRLVDLAFDRAINGSDEPVFDRDGRRVGRRMKPSDRMLMFLLRAYMPDRFRHAHESARHPWEAPPSDAPPLAQAIASLAPAAPADPHQLLSPGEFDAAIEAADLCDEGFAAPPCDDAAPPRSPLGDAFEAALELAKAQARIAAGEWAEDDPDVD